METYEALAITINRDTVCHAKALGLSTSLVNKWQEPSTDFSDSGAYNPLDRLRTVILTSKTLGQPPEVFLAPLYYFRSEFNLCIFPLPDGTPGLQEITAQLYTVIKQFGDLIRESSEAISDGRITPDERRRVDKYGQNLLHHLGLFLQQIHEAAK